MYCIEEKLATLLGPFGATQSSGARGIVRLFPPSLHPWFDILRLSALLLYLHSPECRTTCQNSEITAKVVMKITAKGNDAHNIFANVSETPVRPTIISAFVVELQ